MFTQNAYQYSSSSLSEVKNDIIEAKREVVQNIEIALLKVSESSHVDIIPSTEVFASSEILTDNAKPAVTSFQEDLIDLDWPVGLTNGQNYSSDGLHQVSTIESTIVVESVDPSISREQTIAVPEASVSNVHPTQNGAAQEINIPESSTGTLAPEVSHTNIEHRLPHRVTKGLIDDKPAVSTPHSHEPTPALIQAVMKSDIEEVRRLVASNCDIDIPNPNNGKTSLMIAATLGYSDIFNLLLSRSAAVNLKDRIGRSALHYAVSEGCRTCVTLLLASSANLEDQDVYGDSPFHRAIQYDRLDIVKAFLAVDIYLLSRPNGLGETPVHLAVRYASLELISLLCEKGQSIGLLDHKRQCLGPKSKKACGPLDCQGYSVVQRAIIENKQVVTSLLLEYLPCGINERWIHHGITKPGGISHWIKPIHYAIDHRGSGILSALLNAGADVEAMDSQHNTPLKLAIRYRSQNATEALLRHGAKFHFLYSGCPYMTHLEAAINTFSDDIIDCVMNSQSKHDLSTDGGILLLRQAQKWNKWDAVWQLINNSSGESKIGKIIDEEQTIKFAVQDSQEEIVDFLLEKGADANGRLWNSDEAWFLPLHLLRTTNQLQILLRHGADILSKDSVGLRPLHQIIGPGSENLVQEYVRATTDAIKRTQRSRSEFDKDIEYAMLVACRMGDLKKIKLVFDLRIVLFTACFNEALHSAVKFGRVDTVKFLLARDYSPKERDRKKRLPSEIAFVPLERIGNQLGNRIEDYEECKKILDTHTARKSKSSSSKR